MKGGILTLKMAVLSKNGNFYPKNVFSNPKNVIFRPKGGIFDPKNGRFDRKISILTLKVISYPKNSIFILKMTF